MTRPITQLDYCERVGICDISVDQNHSWVRSPRLMVRGEEGEINQTTVRLLQRFDAPFQFELVRRDTGQAGNLEGYSHRTVSGGGEVLYRNPFQERRWNDGEITLDT